MLDLTASKSCICAFSISADLASNISAFIDKASNHSILALFDFK
ncbi:hypothetical protein [Clostridium perfringens]|nr:hypothetical protein [Clostridium perfringens]